MDLPPRPELLEIYRSIETIAVVGASADPDKNAHTVPRYLQAHGYRIIPVNPRGGEILGETAAASLADITEPIDVVDVFRPPAEGPAIAAAAAAAGARIVWFQPGTESEEAVAAAAGAGIGVIAGHCMRATHQLLGLGDAS
jgi:predicted CoA-binding protein